MTIFNKQETVYYRGAEIQTEINFSSNTLCSLYTPLDTNAKSSTVIASTHSLSLPFRRLSKSTRKCFLYKIYFSDSTAPIPDPAQIGSLLNKNMFIQAGSRTYEDHRLIENYLKQSVTTNVIEAYPDTCGLKIEELMKILETIKSELSMLNLKEKESIKRSPISFDDSYRFTSNEYHKLTGLYRK